MPNPTQLRLAAREVFNEALAAVDAGAAVRRAVRLEDSLLSVCDKVIDLSAQQSIYAIAIGKAAFAMASALQEILEERLTAGVLSTNAPGYRTARGSERVEAPQVANLRYQLFQGGHPEP